MGLAGIVLIERSRSQDKCSMLLLEDAKVVKGTEVEEGMVDTCVEEGKGSCCSMESSAVARRDASGQKYGTVCLRVCSEGQSFSVLWKSYKIGIIS
jgi:hypothetical protein